MFFDESDTTDDFFARLIEIAQLQNELLGLRYNYTEKTPKSLPVKRKGLFGKEQILPIPYLEKAALLKEKQRALTEERQQNGCLDGLVWWNLPWERVIPLLMQNLSFPKEELQPDCNGWRRGFSFELQPGMDDRQLLCLKMQAHYQNTSASRNIQNIEHSAYTGRERDQMVEDYNDKKNMHALLHMGFADHIGVHSITTGMDYDRASDYYTSEEYISGRMFQSEVYSESLYTIEEQNALYLNTHSENRISLHGVCEFHVDAAGALDSMISLDFLELCASDSASTYTSDFFRTRDAIVIGALLLAENSSVRSVPLSLFENNHNPNDYTDVIRLAEIMTCLAQKLERK